MLPFCEVFRNTDNFGVSCSRETKRQRVIKRAVFCTCRLPWNKYNALWFNVKCARSGFTKCENRSRHTVIVDQPALKYNCKLCLFFQECSLLQLYCIYIIIVPHSRLGGWEDLLDELARTLLQLTAYQVAVSFSF